MKIRPLVCLAGLVVTQAAFAQTPAAPGITVDPSINSALPAVRLTDEQLEQLLAPIALYPDALIALILPASVSSTDIVLAARHVRDFPNDRSQIEHRAWDESVKSLTHYPEVLKWMDENLNWTKQVGEAFSVQPADVMQAIQRIRARARAAGTLIDTPQQQVLAEPDVIRIVPAQPDIIYVPRYEPEIVFVREPHYYTAPVITFGLGYSVGSWLAYECDWRRRTIWVGDRYRSWRGHDWRRPIVPIAPPHVHQPPPGVRQWRPPPRPHYHPRSSTTVVQTRYDIVRPTPVGTPHIPRTWSNSFADRAAPTPNVNPTPTTPRDAGSRHFPRYTSNQPRLNTPEPAASVMPQYTSPVPAPAPVSVPSTAPRANVAREHPARSHTSALATPRVIGPMPTPAQAAASPVQQQRMTTRASPAPAAAAPAPAPVVNPVSPEPPPSAVRQAPASNTTTHRGRIYNPPRANDAER